MASLKRTRPLTVSDGRNTPSGQAPRDRGRWKAVLGGLALWHMVAWAWASGCLAYEGDPGLKGATLKGQVIFVGPLKKPRTIRVDENVKFCGETIEDRALLVDPETRGLGAALVSLEGVTRGKSVSKDQLLPLTNRACQFMPRSNAVMVDGMLELRNTDPILHNTHIREGDQFGPTLINIAQPPGNPPIQKPLREPGFLDVRCRKHTFMRASIHVFEHPYFFVTDRDGGFVLTDVPAGTYQMRIWHERLGTTRRSITVPADGTVSVVVEWDGRS